MKDLQIKLQKLENELDNLFKKEEVILNKIKEQLDDEIMTVKVSFYTWRKAVKIDVQPKSAWTEVIELYILNDKEILQTASGGWNDDSKALEEFTYCFNKLSNFVKTFDRNIVVELYSINKEINKVNKEIKEVETQIKIKQKEKNYKKADINELIEKAKNGEVVEFFTITENGYEERNVMFYNGKNFRVNNRVIGVKRIPNMFPTVYVK